MASEDAELRRKHRRSPEDGAEEGSKRRKHSHHRSSHRHHHHHRHRSKKHEQDNKKEGEDLPILLNSFSPPPPPPPIPAFVANSRAEEDKEEGEILEEEEEEGCGFDEGELLKRNAESDVESGEIKPDEAAEKPDNRNLGIHENGYTSFAKDPDEAELNLNDLPEGNSPAAARDKTEYGLPEFSDGKDVNKVHDQVDAPKHSRGEDLTLNGKERGRGKNELSAGMGTGKSEENKGEKQHGDSFCRDRTPTLVTEDFNLRSGEGNRAMHKDSESSLEGAENKKKNRGVGEVASKGQGRSRTPLAKDDADPQNHRKMNDRRSRKDCSRDTEDCNSVRYTSSGPSQSLYFDRSSSGNRNKSMSPEREEMYEFISYSSSHEVYHNAANLVRRSRSHDHARRRRSRSRSRIQDGNIFHDELNLKSYSDANDQGKLISSLEKTSYKSDRERVVGHDRKERHGSRDRVRERESEWNSSYNRHSVPEDINGSLEKERVRERKRDRSSSHSRLSLRQERYESHEDERGRERKRERSSSYSRHSLQEDKNGSRERERERERARESERERERDREKEKGPAEAKDRDKERNSIRDRYRDRERDRNRVREIEKERGRDSHKDSRRSKHNEPGHHHDRARSNDQVRISNSINDNLEAGVGKLKRDDGEQEDYEEKVALKLAEREEEDIDRIKEESRKRRQAILEKYKQNQLQKQVQPDTDVPREEKGSVAVEKPMGQSSSPKTVVSDAPEGLPTRSDDFDVSVADASFSVGKSPQKNENSAFERNHSARGLGDGSPKSERSADMFDDIFGESPAGIRKMGKGEGVQVERSGLNDNWDDAEGYYSYRFGEVLDGRYEVIAAHGKGVFSTVVRAKDLKAGKGDPEEVAIKIIRNNDTMYKAGLEELVILKKLVAADPEDRRHCVRFLSSFKYRNHLCLVFESLHMNLREVLKKFGRNIGLKLTAVRAYAKQLFTSLKHLRNCGVLHCDIKPDNMLVNEAKNVLKLCDFGNAMFTGKNEITPYLVSRFYRAPEIILGLAYDHPMDIWSVGCCLYELYSGKVLFPGPSNNDMLRLHMELKGSFPKKMLRKGAFTDQHFDQDLSFHATEEDPVTKKAIKRLIANIKPKDIGTLIISSPGEDPKMLANFKDLLEKIFVLDPEKRMTVSQALSHPFITGK